MQFKKLKTCYINIQIYIHVSKVVGENKNDDINSIENKICVNKCVGKMFFFLIYYLYIFITSVTCIGVGYVYRLCDIENLIY